MVSINNNINSLRVMRNLSAATDSLSRTFERLSSGQRINRASDDAAGLAIADSLRTNTRLYGAASRNINDGISALNIAGSALEQQISILQRLSELAEQSANGTYSADQRASANTEYQALVKELGRTGDTTSFNGLALLLAGRSGQSSSINLQTGIDGRSSSGLTVATQNTGTLSGTMYAARIFGTGATTLAGAQSTFDDMVTNYQGQLISMSLTDASGTTRNLYLGLEHEAGQYQFRVYVKNSDIGPDNYSYNGEITISGQNRYLDMGAIVIATDSAGRPTSSTVSASYMFNSETVKGAFDLDISGLTFQRSSNAAAMQVLPGDVSGSTAIELSGIETVTRAQAALTLSQARQTQLSSLQGQIGAAQSRLESSLRIAGTAQENSQAAESRIRDADVADETARLAAAQIKQQTAAQVLAQSNNQTRLALQLLQI